MRSLLQYALIILYIQNLNAVKFRCDYRYTPVGWFKYHEIPATWRDARLQCKLEGGMLASPTTAAIKSVMLESFCTEIFTGIHATFAKGQYTSINGIPLEQFSHEWAALEPDNKNNSESCLTLNVDGKLADVSCDEPRPYICHRENSYVDVTVCGTPDPEYHFNSQTNSCYKFHTIPRNFERAFFACSAEGGHLAIINSEAEAIFLRQLYAKYPASKLVGRFHKDFAFIGFHSWGENFDWTTIHGQSLQDAGFATFAAGQPDNTSPGEYCGSIYRHGLLNDMGCANFAPFICEKRVEYPAVCDTAEASKVNATVCEPAIDIRGSVPVF